jgi:hypothetical protein
MKNSVLASYTCRKNLTAQTGKKNKILKESGID